MGEKVRGGISNMAKKIRCDIQCSNCGKRKELSNTVDDSVAVIKSGWNSIGVALYCPDCVNKITNNGYANRLAGEKNTFIVIMNWLLR